MLKKTFLKSIKLFSQKPLKMSNRYFSLKTSNFNPDDVSEFDFSLKKNSESKNEFSQNQNNSESENTLFLLKLENLIEMEKYINSLDSKIPNDSIGIFLKMNCHLIKNSKSKKEISNFFSNKKLRGILSDLFEYFEKEASDLEFVDFLEFWHLAEKFNLKKHQFGINFKIINKFNTFILDRIMKDSYDILNLTKILLFEKNHYFLNLNAKRKLLNLIRIEKNIEDFLFVMFFQIIAQDSNYLDEIIFDLLLEKRDFIFELSTRDLVSIFYFLSFYQKKKILKKNFMIQIAEKIEEEKEYLESSSIDLLLQSFLNLDNYFPDLQKYILEKVIDKLENNPHFVFNNCIDLIKYFSNIKQKIYFHQEYKKFINTINKIETDLIPLGLFNKKKKLLFLVTSPYDKIRNDIQPFFENIINTEKEKTSIIKISPIFFLINKNFLKKIWPNINLNIDSIKVSYY